MIYLALMGYIISIALYFYYKRECKWLNSRLREEQGANRLMDRAYQSQKDEIKELKKILYKINEEVENGRNSWI